MEVGAIGIIGLILATVVLVVGAYNGLSALPLSLAAGLVVILTNQMPLWPSFHENYMAGYVGFFRNFFLIFAASALYAKIMEESGAALSIGYKFIDWFGAKRAVLVVFVTTAALTYGGISLFVVVFAISPIIMKLFQAGNIPRRFAMGPLLAGAATFTMKSLPGSPQLTNVVPTGFLGTTLTAAPVLGILSAIFMFILQVIYFNWEEKRLRATGEGFTFIPGANVEIYNVDRAKLPAAWKSFLPMVIVVGMIVVLRFWVPTTPLVVLSMIIASVVALLLFWGVDALKSPSDLKKIINTGTGGAITAIAAPAAVVAFGAVVQASPAFRVVVDGLLGLDMHIYALAAIAPSILAGITGSSSGGLLISMQALSDTYIASGADLGILHRLTATFAGTLDTLPHSPGLFLMFAYLGITHKEGYRFVLFGTVLIPTFVGILVLLGLMIFGIGMP